MRLEMIVKWPKGSGLVVNESKTEICLFHTNDQPQMHRLFNQCQPESEFINLNFQLNQNPRIRYANFFIRQNYNIGKNILLNRLAHINDKIEKSWLDQSLNTFKIKCKRLFLQST